MCLDAAVTSGDIRGCREIYTACSRDAIETINVVIDTAIDTAEDAIQLTADTATNVIMKAAGFSSDAFGVLQQCRDDVTDCLDGVTSTADVRTCHVIFDGCAADAVDLVDNTVAPLPLPTDLLFCNTDFASCIVQLKSPFDCASDARACIGL